MGKVNTSSIILHPQGKNGCMKWVPNTCRTSSCSPRVREQANMTQIAALVPWRLRFHIQSNHFGSGWRLARVSLESESTVWGVGCPLFFLYADCFSSLFRMDFPFFGCKGGEMPTAFRPVLFDGFKRGPSEAVGRGQVETEHFSTINQMTKIPPPS